MAFRLPRTVEPEVYRIEIEPDIASATFSGTVAIDAIILEPVQEIVLNAAELAVSDVEVRMSDGSIVACTVTFDDELEWVRFQASTDLPPGPCTLSCRFTGTLNDKLPRVLPVHLHQARWGDPHHRHDAIRVGRCPALLSLL